MDVLAALLVPDFGKSLHGFATILPAIAEPSMVLYLLIKGVRTVDTQMPRGASSQPLDLFETELDVLRSRSGAPWPKDSPSPFMS